MDRHVIKALMERAMSPHGPYRTLKAGQVNIVHARLAHASRQPNCQHPNPEELIDVCCTHCGILIIDGEVKDAGNRGPQLLRQVIAQADLMRGERILQVESIDGKEVVVSDGGGHWLADAVCNLFYSEGGAETLDEVLRLAKSVRDERKKRSDRVYVQESGGAKLSDLVLELFCPDEKKGD